MRKGLRRVDWTHIDCHDKVEMLSTLERYRVDHLDVALMLRHAVRQGLAQHQVVGRAVDDGVGREGRGEPALLTRVEDAATVREGGHVPGRKERGQVRRTSPRSARVR